jgi:hypothetical protein
MHWGNRPLSCTAPIGSRAATATARIRGEPPGRPSPPHLAQAVLHPIAPKHERLIARRRAGNRLSRQPNRREDSRVLPSLRGTGPGLPSPSPSPVVRGLLPRSVGGLPLRGGQTFLLRSLFPIRPHVRTYHSAFGANGFGALARLPIGRVSESPTVRRRIRAATRERAAQSCSIWSTSHSRDRPK